MSEITSLRTMKDVFDTINEKYPTWIIDILPEYSDDYKFLTNHWEQICNKAKTSRQKIILVTHFDQNTEHLAFAELLTQTGFVVRTVDEFIPCSTCKKILPTYKTHTIFMNSKNKDQFVFPSEWKPTCNNPICSPCVISSDCSDK